MPQPQIANLFGLSQAGALVVVFVFLPFVVAAVVVPYVMWRSRNDPKPILTSDILAHGLPGEAEIISVKNLGGLLDMRPMIHFMLRVNAGPGQNSFDLEVVQSLPRGMSHLFRTGDLVEVRLTPDHSAGAVVWGQAAPDF